MRTSTQRRGVCLFLILGNSDSDVVNWDGSVRKLTTQQISTGKRLEKRVVNFLPVATKDELARLKM